MRKCEAYNAKWILAKVGEYKLRWMPSGYERNCRVDADKRVNLIT